MARVLVRGATLIVIAASAILFMSLPAPGAVNPTRTVINATAELGQAGRTVRITGRVRCPPCASMALAVTVSQRNGALAQGGARCRCHAATERWKITARVRGATRLRAGPAQICAWVIARGPDGKSIDAYQWCRDATLA